MNVRILQAITSVRVGDGAAVDAVDLPLARERHTRWPFIPGSALKGALRARAHRLGVDVSAIEAVFGSEPPLSHDDETDLRKGTLAVGGAVLLALPVRALHATFVLLTCPTALARFGRLLPTAPALPQPGIHQAAVADQRRASPTRATLGARAAGVLFVEDLDLEAVDDASTKAWSARLAEMCPDAPLDHLVVVHDDVFAHACAAWTEQRTRNSVAADGVVDDGKLFTVESLPAETLWWVWTEGKEGGLLPDNGAAFVVGGHQSVGMGRVAWYAEVAS